MQIDGHYSAFCVSDLGAAIAGIRGMNIRGASVTIPFKTAVMEYLDEIDADAAALGAVNTIVNDRGRLTGYNTDWLGLMQALKDKMQHRGENLCHPRRGRHGAGGGLRHQKRRRPADHCQSHSRKRERRLRPGLIVRFIRLRTSAKSKRMF